VSESNPDTPPKSEAKPQTEAPPSPGEGVGKKASETASQAAAKAGELANKLKDGLRTGADTLKRSLENMSTLLDDIVIALGSDYVQIASREHPQPSGYGSHIAISKENGQLIALGQKARELSGLEPQNIQAQPLLIHGMPEEPELFTTYIQRILKKQFSAGNLIRPRLVCSGNFYSPLLRTICSESLFQIRSRDVLLCEPEVAAAVGMGLDIMKPDLQAVMIFERDWLGFSVISMTGSLVSVRLNIGFQDLMQDIHIYFQESRDFAARREDLEQQFSTYGFTGTQKLAGWESWVDQLERGKPQVVRVDSLEYQRAVSPTLLRIKYRVNGALDGLSREQRYTVQTTPTYLAGQYADLPGLKELLQKVFGREFLVPENPHQSMVQGLVKLIPQIDSMRSIKESADSEFDF